MFETNFFSPEFFNVHIVLVFAIGLLFGSFLNVCIYRLPAGMSIVYPRSHCFSCGVPIHWYDNIPLLSYIILGGRCRYCGSAFSIRYFLIELLTGIMFAITFYRFRYTPATPVYITFLCLLIVATFTDIDCWIIPDGVSLGGLIFGLFAALLAGLYPRGFIVAGAWPLAGGAFYTPFVNAIIGAAVGASLLYIIGVVGSFLFHKEAMGFGDVKLLALVGAFLGAINCLYVLMLASVSGSIIGGSILLAQKIAMHRIKNVSLSPPEKKQEPSGEDIAEIPLEELTAEEREERIIENILAQSKCAPGGDFPPPPTGHHIPFGPFIALGAAIVLLWGESLNQLLFGLMQ